MAPEMLVDMLDKVMVSPYEEMLAFEYLYSLEGSTLKRMTESTVLSDKLPSEVMRERFGLIKPEGLDDVAQLVDAKLGNLSVAVNNTTTWPDKLADSERPTPLFYYYGNIGLIEQRSVSVVGSRKATRDGLARAAKLAKQLAEIGVVVVSGLARGIDTAALEASLGNGGRVIGVIGTPIDECYPPENRRLQELIGKEHLLVSQVPFYRYAHQPFKTRRFYFPERNELMAAISDATVIVEASDTSGTLTQARACMHQGRPLFIMRSCVENDAVTWPAKWIGRDNVHVLDDVSQIIGAIGGEGGRDGSPR